MRRCTSAFGTIRMKILSTWALAIVLVSAACSSGTSVAEQARYPVIGKTVDSPLRVMFETEVGYSSQEISAALLNKKGEVVSACLRRLGFEPLASEIPSSDVGAARPRVVGGMALQAIATLERGAADSSAGQIDTVSNPARDAAIDTCYVEARAVPNPVHRFLIFVSVKDEELEARINSDPRTSAASRRMDTCVAALGYDVVNASELSNYFTERSNALVVESLDGGGSIETAIESLRVLSIEEEAAASVVGECHERWRIDISTVRAEYEAEFLGKFGDALRDELADVRRAVENDLL